MHKQSQEFVINLNNKRYSHSKISLRFTPEDRESCRIRRELEKRAEEKRIRQEYDPEYMFKEWEHE